MRSMVLAAVMLAAIGCKGGGAGADGPIGPPTPCGNNTLDPDEICDDGNNSGGDGCSADCTSDETCGNLVADLTVGEVCDDGNGIDGDGCSADCRSDETCGNHIVDSITGETCDDGNSNAGDGCSANCQSNESCGNNVTDVGEECDNGPTATPGCDPDCTNVRCGDGTRNAPAGEACDDGNMVDTDGCVGCQTAFCGDGHTRTSGPAGTIEQCDDGGNGNNDACLDSCVTNVCHDGYWNPSAEQCDDGNTSDSDDCVDGCRNAGCGDGHIWIGHESCDDGNTNNGDGCDASCQVEVMQMPMTYVINDPSMLVNLTWQCDGLNQNWYDYDPTAGACGASQWGFRWNDATPYTPSSIVVEFNRGIDCTAAPVTLNTYVNGGYTGTFTVDENTGGSACACTPPEEIHGWGLSGIGGYVVGGTNTFTLDPFGNCIGISYEDSWGGYARVTVYP